MAQAALANPNAAKAETRGFALGPELGQCCGGNVEVIVEIIESNRRAEIEALAKREEGGALTTRGRLVSDQGVIREIVEDALPPGAAAYASGVLTEGFGDERRPLVLFGAGHVGRALVMALAPLPFRVTWVDPRPDVFPDHVPANVTTVQADEPAKVLSDAHRRDVRAGHDPQPPTGPRRCSSRAWRSTFSLRRRDRFKDQTRPLRAVSSGMRGFPPARVAELVCPIGAGAIHSKLPAVIAAMTVIELLERDESLKFPVADRSEARVMDTDAQPMTGARAAERLPGEATLEAIGITKDFVSLRANDHIDFSINARRDPRAPRRERRREVDAGEDPLRRAPADRGRSPLEGPAGDHPEPGGGAAARHRHGVPALLAVRGADGRREHLAGARRRAGRSPT